MSLVPKKEKKNKTEDFNAYHKQYREQNIDHVRNLERANYYKRTYGLTKDFIDLYGEYSGDVYKIIKSFRMIMDKCPSLGMHIISELQSRKEDEPNRPMTPLADPI